MYALLESSSQNSLWVVQLSKVFWKINTVSTWIQTSTSRLMCHFLLGTQSPNHRVLFWNQNWKKKIFEFKSGFSPTFCQFITQTIILIEQHESNQNYIQFFFAYLLQSQISNEKSISTGYMFSTLNPNANLRSNIYLLLLYYFSRNFTWKIFLFFHFRTIFNAKKRKEMVFFFFFRSFHFYIFISFTFSWITFKFIFLRNVISD